VVLSRSAQSPSLRAKRKNVSDFMAATRIDDTDGIVMLNRSAQVKNPAAGERIELLDGDIQFGIKLRWFK